MTLNRIFTISVLLSAVATFPAAAQTGDTRARVDTNQSHTVYYPPNFETSNEDGTVTLTVGVSEKGEIARVALAQSSGHHDLDLAAAETVMNWHFVPAIHDGDPHPDEITLRVVYDRPDPAAPAAH